MAGSADLFAIQDLEERLLGPRTRIRGWSLLVLYHRPTHGYGLSAPLQALGFDVSRSRLYRGLSWLAETGLVRPRWDTGSRGPARRVYALTEDGLTTLVLLRPGLRGQARQFRAGAKRLALLMLDEVERGARPIRFSVNVQLVVTAVDEAAARGKLVRVLDQAGRFDSAVRYLDDPRIDCASTGPGSAPAGPDLRPAAPR